MEVIVTKSLSKKFDLLTAVDEVSFSVSMGEIFGFVGPDGAGKTTLLRLLTSIMEPSSGEAFVFGLHTVQQAERIKEKIGYLSQKCGLYPDLSVMENLEFFADIYSIPRKHRDKKIYELLEFSHLSPFKNRLAGKLSGGMKQKLGLACALIHKPELLFLDEPTYGVDPMSRRELWRILYQLVGSKVTIVLATSDMNEAERCSRLGLMYKGKIVAQGAPEEMRSFYQGGLIEVKHENPSEAFKILRKEFGSAIRQFGGKIHLITSHPEQDRERIVQLLKECHVGKYELSNAEPSLEDVFIGLVSGYESGINDGK